MQELTEGLADEFAVMHEELGEGYIKPRVRDSCKVQLVVLLAC